jgi:hypothetical protein
MREGFQWWAKESRMNPRVEEESGKILSRFKDLLEFI